MTERISLSEADGDTNLLFGDRKLTVHQGDVLLLSADAIVCPVDQNLNVKSGLARACLHSAGADSREERPLLPEPFGKVVVLPGGNLRAKYIFLSVLLGQTGIDNLQSSIRQAVDRAIRYAEFLRLKSIAFPLMGCPKNSPPYDLVARLMIEEVAQYLTRRKTRLKLVLFSIHNTDAFGAFRREARSLAGK